MASFSGLDQAIGLANATPFGLAACAFTGSHAKAESLSRGIRAGMVGINTFLVAHAEAPFGGFDHSGMGRQGGPDAISDDQNAKLTHFIWR
ncbi:MAG: aldehyde dehydrogenase family protein [Beijerinckiaceae bacterium]